MWSKGLEDASRVFYEYKDIDGMLKILEPLQTALMKEPEVFSLINNDGGRLVMKPISSTTMVACWRTLGKSFREAMLLIATLRLKELGSLILTYMLRAVSSCGRPSRS